MQNVIKKNSKARKDQKPRKLIETFHEDSHQRRSGLLSFSLRSSVKYRQFRLELKQQMNSFVPFAHNLPSR